MGQEVKPKGYKKLIIALVVVVAIVVVLLIPMIPTSEAYNVTEHYNRECTYVDDSNLEEKLGVFDVYVQSEVKVRNTDKYGGTFQVVHNLYDIDGLFGTETDSFYLGAGQSHISTVTFDTRWGQDTRGTYSVSAPTVTDEQLVTKHKTVYKSIIEIMLYR